MKKVPVLCIAVVILLIDIFLTTVFYCKGDKFHDTFSHAVATYSFTTSVFELWLLGIVRFSVIIGLIFGTIRGKELAVHRIKSLQVLPIGLSGCIFIFTLIKLLSVSEDLLYIDSKWFWFLFSWTLCGSVIFPVEWRLLGSICVTSPSGFSVNCDGDLGEREALLGTEKQPEEKNEKKERNRKGAVLRLLAYSKPDWVIILLAFIFLTLSSTGEIFIPFYTGRVVDGIVIDKSQKDFTHAIMIMSLISVGSALAAGIRGGCFTLSSDRLNIRLRKNLFKSLLVQEVGFFDKTQTGDITSRLTSDTTTMSDTLGLNINILLRNLIKAGGVLFFMFKLSWRLTLITFIGLPVMIAVSKVYGHYYKKLQEEVQNSLADANNVAEEACSTMRTVRSFANEAGEVQRYSDKLAYTYKLNKKQAVMYSGFVWSNMLFELALTVSVLYYGGHLVLAGTVTGGTLISFILYQIQLGDCVDQIGFTYTGLMQAAGASEKVFEYINRKPAISDHGSLVPDDIQGHIEFKNVCFSYPSRPNVQVLRNISFTVKPGEIVALVGPSGGGKTSCVNLIQHFYTADSGQVLLDNLPVEQYEHHYLHKQVSLVGQEPVLYARSIQENISYGLHKDEWTRELVIAAAEMANAHTFITELKEGYETQTGEKGVQMSGGQKQRIAIARALLRKPRVLLLDEATSALDSESEYLVQQALYKNMSGRTVLIIAHRLSTVEKADRIIVIERGQVIEQGTHKELLSKRGIYANLVKRQLLLSDSSWSSDSSTSLRREMLSPAAIGTRECTFCRRRRVTSREASKNSLLSGDESQTKVSFVIGSI